MIDSVAALLAKAQHLADTAITASPRLAGLTDQTVAKTLIRDFFRSLPTLPGRRHMADVGAAHGSIAEVFLCDGWTADLFEPDPACQQALQRLLAAYPGRARLFPFAVGKENLERIQFQQNAITGLSGLTTSPFGATKGTIPVRCVRLGDFLASQNVTRLDFLKIDTEGSDFEVLEAHNFEKFPATLIFVEYSFYFLSQSPDLLRAVIGWMDTHGYKPLIFDYSDDGNFRRDNWEHRLVSIHLDVARVPTRPDSFGNILFYRKGDAHLLKTLIALIEKL